jgi:hypothetical protein
MNRRIPLVFSAGIFFALVIGTLIPSTPGTLFVVTAFLFLATLGTVGGLEYGWQLRAKNYQGALRLLLINLLAGSVPMAIVGILLGPSTPAGLGFLLLAIVPVAAGVPAYANALGVPAERITLFALMSYLLGLIVTPILMAVIAGRSESQSALWFTVAFGLVLPSVLGILLARPISSIRIGLRRTVILSSLLLVMAGVGSALGSLRISFDSLGAPLGLIVLIGLARAPLGALIARGLNHVRRLQTSASEAMLSGGYRNCAFACVAALALGVPEAAIPGALGLASEAILMATLAFRRPPVRHTTGDGVTT